MLKGIYFLILAAAMVGLIFLVPKMVAWRTRIMRELHLSDYLNSDDIYSAGLIFAVRFMLGVIALILVILGIVAIIG